MYQSKFVAIPPGHTMRADEWPETLMLEPYSRTTIFHLLRPREHSPKKHSAWLVGRRKTDVRVNGKLVDVALCVETDCTLRASVVVERDMEPTALLEVIWDALLDPKPGCDFYRPLVVACDEEAMAEKLQPLLAQLGIEAGVADVCKPLDVAFRRLRLYPLKGPKARG